MKKICLLIVVLITAYSCKNNKPDIDPIAVQEVSTLETQFNTIKKDALDAHDVIMPQMGTLLKYKKELDVADYASNPRIDTLKLELQKAYDDMNVWMRSYSAAFPYDYKLPSDPTQAQEKINGMQLEKEKITELKERTQRVIEEAQVVLKK